MLEGPPDHWTGPWVWGFAPSSSLRGILLLALPCSSFLELGAVPSPVYPKHQTLPHTHIHTHIVMPYTLQSHSYTLQSQLHTLWSHDSILTHTHTLSVTPTTPHNTPATPLVPPAQTPTGLNFRPSLSSLSPRAPTISVVDSPAQSQLCLESGCIHKFLGTWAHQSSVWA